MARFQFRTEKKWGKSSWGQGFGSLECCLQKIPNCTEDKKTTMSGISVVIHSPWCDRVWFLFFFDPPGNIPFSQMQILVPILFIWWLGPHWVDQNAITSQYIEYILSDCESFIPRTLTIVADLRRCGDLFVRLILSTPSITSMKERCFLMWHVARQHLTSCTQQTHRSTKGKQDWILNQNRFYNVV